MSTWQQDRICDFRAMLKEWPNTITKGSATADCIKTPDIVDKGMMPSKYLTDIRATFDVLTTDFLNLGLGSRSQFICGDEGYEIIRYKINPDDPIVQFDSVKLK